MAIKKIYGMAWYEKEDWAAIKKQSADSDSFADSFENWLASSEKTKSFFEKEGYEVVKVFLKYDEILNWCEIKNCKLHESSRSRYVTEMMKVK